MRHPALLRHIFQAAGAHVWSDGGDVLHSGNGVLFVHTLTGGPRRLRLRNGKLVSIELAPRSTTLTISGSDSATPSVSMPPERTCADSVLRVAGSLIVSNSTPPSRSVNSSEGMQMSARTGGWLTSGSIQSSLLKALAVTIGGALLMAATLLVVMEVLTHRRAAETNLRALASVIALYSEAALEFEDHAAGNEALAALQSVPNIEAGILYDANGNVFASFGGTRADALLRSADLTPGVHYGASSMDMAYPIQKEGQLAGSLLVRRSTADLMGALILEEGARAVPP